MLCNEELPLSFYINKASDFLQSDLIKNAENFKLFIGVDDDGLNKLLENENIRNIYELVK